MKKLFIKKVESTGGGQPGFHLGVDCSDGTSYTVPRDVSRKTFWDATIAVLEEDGKVITLAKIKKFGEDGRPVEWSNLIRDTPLVLDGTEEVVDCR